MTSFVWGGAKEKGVDIDYIIRETCWLLKQDMTMPDLPHALPRQKEEWKACECSWLLYDDLPISKISYDMYVPDIIEAYVNAER